MRRQDAWPLGAMGFILAVTASWWALALWSAPGAPEWLERTRSVCFNITESGLPDAKGWLLLLGQPPSMLAVLLIGWREEVVGSLRRLVAFRSGRVAVVGTATLVLIGLGLAGQRVAGARVPEVVWGGGELGEVASQPRLDRAWPRTAGLVDQTGAEFTLERLGGSPAMVTFAFGHCATLCPVVVHQTRTARSELGETAIVVLTLDPWRDTPGRLEPLREQFGLDAARDFVVGGSVEAVEAALDAWGVSRERDPRTGDIVHPGVVYLVEADGTIAYASTGGADGLLTLGRRLWEAATP